MSAFFLTTNLKRAEIHNVTTSNLGLFNLTIGQGSNQTGSFANIAWTNGTKLLEVIIDGTSGGTQPIWSVPYALYSEKTNLQAGNGINVNGNTITNVPDIAIFEERTAYGVSTQPIGGIWNKRLLNTTVKPSPTNAVVLSSNNILFNQPGTYLITASAPAYRVHKHRLVLRKNDNNAIIMFGTSEFGAVNLNVHTRSHIIGTLTITTGGEQYFLEHYITDPGIGEGALGVAALLPVPFNTAQDYETYAQIMIQKIQ